MNPRLLPLIALLAAAFEATPALAADSLVIGVLPRRNVTGTVSMFRPLAAELERAIGRRVEIRTARDFNAFWHEVGSGRYDVVHLNQVQYIKSHRLYGYRAIAKNEEHGKSTVRGAVVVRTDSGISTLGDLKGKRIAFGGGRLAVVSYLIPTALLRQAGLKPSDYEEVFTRNPMNAVVVTYIGEADASGANSLAIQPGFVTGVDATKLRLLAQSEPLPHLPWAVSAHLAPALAMRIQNTLTGLQASAAGRRALASAQLTGLVTANDSDYDPHRRLFGTR